MNIDTIRQAQEAAKEIRGWSKNLPEFLEDVERVIDAAKKVIEQAEDMSNLNGAGGAWVPDALNDALRDALARIS